MSYELKKVFDVCKFPEHLKKEVGAWFGDLNRTAVNHMVETWTKEEALELWGVPDECSKLDTYLVENGAKNGEFVILIYDW